MELHVNGQRYAVPQAWQEESLLHVLREHLGLVGSKFGCGVGQCGACTVLLEDTPARSCVLPVASVGAQAITTVEGLAEREGALHPLQRLWLSRQVPQCGFCQAGQLMCATALLRRTAQPTAAQIDEAMAHNLCRCGTQHRIRHALATLTEGGT